MNQRYYVLLIALTLGVGWTALSYLWMAESKIAAMDAKQNRQRLVVLAADIEQLKSQADQAQYGVDAEDLGGKSARSLCTSAGIPIDRISEIVPRRTRVSNSSSYDREEIVFRLREITVGQVVRLMIEAENAGKAFVSSGFQLSPSNRGGINADSTSRETWDAEVTLTRLVFITKSPSEGSGKP
ncbi:MAG: hypothetical protein J0M26_20470 [Planctomycetes bacterium]|nr:hypothetical protein [Planctomycetota bacterium]